MKKNKKPNLNNYYWGTHGNFRSLCHSWQKKIEKLVYKYHDWYENAEHTWYDKQVQIRLGNRTFRLVYNSRGESFYFVDTNEEYLIRVSNHWSKVQGPATSCGWVSSCYWQLVGRNNRSSFPAGMIRFDELNFID